MSFTFGSPCSYFWPSSARMLVYRKWRKRPLSLVAFVVGVFLLSQNFGVPGDQSQWQLGKRRSSGTPVNDGLHVVHNTFEEPGNKTVSSKENLKSDGYQLAKRTNAKCQENTYFSYAKTVKVYESHSGDTQLCPIWKIGTTFLKRVILMKTEKKYSHLINPYDIPYDITYKPKRGMMNNDGSRERFMFVRDPYARLLSGFVDKLLAPNPVYWNIISRRAIRAVRSGASALSLKCGHDLEFHEYVKYVIIALSDPWHPLAKKDGHFEQMTALCKPCDMKYDFIGKLETFGVDSMVFLERMASPTTTKLFQGTGGSLSADDAILDTCHQPFDPEFKQGYLECITFYDALQRAWKKLQVRGLIGQRELPVSESEAADVTQYAFVKMARRANFEASSEEKKQVQHEYFLKMFATVSREDLEMVRKVYADDFKYFEYDDRPSVLFDK